MNSWHKSTYSAGQQNCVEVRETPDVVHVRDTQHREAGHLTFPGPEWAALIRSVHFGEL
ncbi:DUF397 domain-containing protein [Nocardiopsis sp. CNT-189]|uniref:DUF397 domain-containing protein n=1 Tax=Nocardiopsis oceanisediminis TaxID=2816862 RepID=UPI003B2E607A